MKLLNKMNLDFLIKLNYIVFLVIAGATLLWHDNLLSGLWVMLLGMLASYLTYKGSFLGYLVYAIQAIYYASIAIKFSLVGEFYSHLVIVSVANIVVMTRALDRKFDTSNYVEYYMNYLPKLPSFTYRMIKYFFIILAFFIINLTLKEIGSAIPDLEAINILLITIASVKMYKNSSEQWLYWLAKGIISIIIWVYIEDRIFILEFYTFDFFYAILTVLNLRKKISFDDE